jgi:guanine deaminase
VGLGTDIAGGAQPGLLSQCGLAATVSRMLHDGVDARFESRERGAADARVDPRIDIVTAFHLGTAGGADVLGIPVGRFAVGQEFDAMVVDTGAGSTHVSSWSGLRAWPMNDLRDDHDRLFEKIVRLAGPSDITRVWVAGRQVSVHA